MATSKTAQSGNLERATPESVEALLFQLARSLSSSSLFSGRPQPHSSQDSESFTAKPEPPDVAARYRVLVEQIPAVIFMAFLDQDLSEAYVSPHVETILGFTQAEWLDDPVRWYNQIHPDDRTRWSVEASQLILSGQPLRSIYRVISRDGRTVWFECQVKIVTAPNGRPWFIHGTAFDITELKETEIALQEARDELEHKVQERTAELAQANRDLQQEIGERKRAQAELAQTVEEIKQVNGDLEQLAYSVSHDLQEPLRTVSLYSQLLRKKFGQDLGSMANEHLGYISSGVGRMHQLLADLRAFIKSSSLGREPVETADANDALRRALTNLTVAVESSHAQILYGALPRVRVHPFQLELLFQNLIGNSIRYRSQQTPQIHVNVEECGGHWTFSVQDNGIGIDPQYKEHIFGIFKRLHNWADYPGTGMGLAICKKIVERAGGRIWVESQIGQGSKFFFTLPRLEEACRTNA